MHLKRVQKDKQKQRGQTFSLKFSTPSRNLFALKLHKNINNGSIYESYFLRGFQKLRESVHFQQTTP